MAVTVKIFTKHGGRPTLFQSRDFDALPVTIGRDATCTLALDDPHKHISRVHVELEEEDGTYWMSVVPPSPSSASILMSDFFSAGGGAGRAFSGNMTCTSNSPISKLSPDLSVRRVPGP